MMINTIREFIVSRGMTAYQLSKETGIAMTTVYRLQHNPAVFPTAPVLDTILNTYPAAVVGDLIQHVRDEVK